MEPDFLFALRLQKELENELLLAGQVKSPHNKENYPARNKNRNGLKGCLVDPSWELIDPTPNIHNLFIQFDIRFFENKLVSVSLEWSKRMTVCAGICSYEGRGGMCEIKLSEPLLKLRPRKDLIETLLHEMIHAYLFVTHNNRDRDGHGPEFHKHMNRINAEAGTKITVYHSFHDEVDLYRTHWWRCNGPCQSRKPYFGLVKRSANRKPGPNDFWWNDHQQKCGGTFIKIREPDKKSKKNGELPTKSIPIADIRNYVQTNSTENKKNISKYNTPATTIIDNKLVNKVTTFKDLDTNSNEKNTQKNIKSINTADKTKGGTLLNKGSSVVLEKPVKMCPKKSTDVENPLRLKTFEPFVGTGHSLSTKGMITKVTEYLTNNTDTTKDDLSVVRSHWASKNIVKTPVKRSQESEELSAVRNHWATKNIAKTQINRPSENGPSVSKKPKTDDNDLSLIDLIDTVECPVCADEISKSIFDSHIDKCLESCSDFTESQDDQTRIETDQNKVLLVENGQKQISCMVCGDTVYENKLNEHLDICLETTGKFFSPSQDDPFKEKKQVPCLVCNEIVYEEELNHHLEVCMKGVFDDDIY